MEKIMDKICVLHTQLLEKNPKFGSILRNTYIKLNPRL